MLDDKINQKEDTYILNGTILTITNTDVIFALEENRRTIMVPLTECINPELSKIDELEVTFKFAIEKGLL